MTIEIHTKARGTRPFISAPYTPVPLPSNTSPNRGHYLASYSPPTLIPLRASPPHSFLFPVLVSASSLSSASSIDPICPLSVRSISSMRAECWLKSYLFLARERRRRVSVVRDVRVRVVRVVRVRMVRSLGLGKRGMVLVYVGGGY